VHDEAPGRRPTKANGSKGTWEIDETSFDARLADPIRVRLKELESEEHWVSDCLLPKFRHLNIEQYSNNKPVADFSVITAKKTELKSPKGQIGTKVVDGAHRTVIERVESNNQVSSYLAIISEVEVVNLLIIPKHFVPEIIEKRKPLKESARRRMDWVQYSSSGNSAFRADFLG
jgi:type II restriction enzyme